jgi:hypothetical protein
MPAEPACEHIDNIEPLEGFEEELQPWTGVDAPLTMRYDTRPSWDVLKSEFGVSETGAAMILDLVSEAGTAGRWTSYSRSKSRYQERSTGQPMWHRRKALSTYDRVIGAVSHLEECDLIDNLIAVHGSPFGTGWQSKMRAKPELVTRVNGLIKAGMPLVLLKPLDTVILRDKNKETMTFKETAKTKAMRRNVEAMNEAFAGMRMEGAFPALAIRIHNESLDRNGRLYLDGGGIQVMKDVKRLQITFDGEAAGEVDFKTMHVTMLYNRVGLLPPRDAYDLQGWPRDLVKVAMLVMLNAPNWASAMLAIARKKKMLLAGITPDKKGAKSQEAQTAAGNLIAAVKKLHKPIHRYFHSGVGAYLMKEESMILDDVMMTMLRRGEVVIPIHDSGLVRVSAVGALEEAMADAAERAGIRGVRLETAYAPS